MTKPLTLQPGHYSYFQFEVPNGAKNVELRGRFEASGGSGNDVEAFVLDSDAFVNWQNNHAVNTLFNSGKVTQKSFRVPLPPEPGRCYLVFSNTYSLVSNKAVAGEVTLHYTRQVEKEL